MQADVFKEYISEINRAYLRGDATEHTHRPALKTLIEQLAKKITATNEPRRTECGAPDFIVSRRVRSNDEKIGYIECKDIGTDLKQVAKTEQIKKRYLPSLHNLILTDYIEFCWYVNEEKVLTAKLAEEKNSKFRITEKGQKDLAVLFDCFFAHEPQRITTAKELAIKMAHKARMMRDLIAKTFGQEQETGPLHGQFEGFKEVLLHDLTEHEFADMYAQTISYGLFTARCHIDEKTLFGKDKQAVFHGMNGKPGEFTREHAAFMLPKTNPFLRSVFGHIAGPDLDDRVAWLVDDLVALLRQADMGEVLRDFARRKGRRDPVVHFYETFLSQYDPKMKKKRGVYYTPDEVVSYIVRSVDWLLKEKFGLRRGLADESKVKLTDQDGKERQVHKLLLLDPAVGTGTFLFEVIDLIHSRFKREKGMWSGYVREHLLPRLFGFDIQMAPYAVCHMKLGLELAETGYDFESEERLGIYLTNTLEEAEEISKNVFVQWLSEEAREANKVKKDLPIMVVLGNPPYSISSQNKSEWILRLLEDYKKGLYEKKLNIDDDFIKFIKFGQHRIEQTGCGILAFISNNTYIDGITHRRMRRSLMETFSEVFILDLHGSLLKREHAPGGGKDKNVFDIQQGVCIGIFVKRPDKEALASVFHADLYGERTSKYDWLAENDVRTTEWEKLAPAPEQYFFVPKDFEERKTYLQWKGINTIFGISGSGIQTDRDSLFFGFEPGAVESRLRVFYSDVGLEQPFRGRYRVENSSSYNLLSRREKSFFDAQNVRPCMYRPFDERWVYYTCEVTSRPGWKVIQHLVGHDNVALIGMRQFDYEVPDYCYVFVTDVLAERRNFISNRGASSLFPLYLYQGDAQTDMDYENWPRGKDGRVPNLSRDFVNEFANKTKLRFLSEGRGDLKKTFGPEDVFDYIYGVLHSPEYRRRYAEFLKIDFPRVPWPKDKDIFVQMSEVGRQLVELHLMKAELLEDEERHPAFAVQGNNGVEKGYPNYVAKACEHGKERVYINKGQYFEGVPLDVWEFHIGGYQVCEKWLKDRRGRELSYDDRRHYQKILVALSETIRLMKKIDEVIDAHAGWTIK